MGILLRLDFWYMKWRIAERRYKEKWKEKLVAGAGFEPATFGL